MTAVKHRDTTLDALKAVAIFMVCWGHCIQFFVNIPYMENSLVLFIYSFHMPLFMALVGYFSSSLLKYSPKEAFLKRFRELILPVITFTTIYALLGVYKVDSIKGYVISLIIYLWFLKSAFICTLLYYLSVHLSPKNKILHAGCIIASLSISLCIPYSFVNAMYPSFLLGCIINRYKEIFAKRSLIILLLAICIFAIVYPLYGTTVYRMAWKFSLISSPFLIKNYLIKLTLGLSGTVCLFALFRLLEKNAIFKRLYLFLSAIGTRTLGIYLIQTLIIENILSNLIFIESSRLYDLDVIILPFAIALIAMLICALIVRTIESNRYTAYFMLGKTRKKSCKT